VEIRPSVLRAELVSVMQEINTQITEVKAEARRQRIPPQQLRDASGNWVWLPLLLAKANVLTALTELNKAKAASD
jgi:hypothetical protein